MRLNWFKYGWLCATFIVLSAVILMAGTTGKLVGKVTDSQTGEALPGVNVILEGTRMGAATDLEGEYIILHVPPGIYTVQASMIGYQISRRENVRVSIDLTTTADLKISSTVLTGEEVTVVAQREIVQKDMTSSLAAVGAEQIQSMPVQEVSDVLELQAGLVRDATGGVHIRGGRSGEVAYWVDGVAATDVYSGDMGLEIENASVQELQVISGTFNAEYGQAMSGIVNIVTKDGGSKLSGEISAYIGDYLPTDGDREFGLYKPKNSDIRAIRSPQADSLEHINPLNNFNNIYNLQGSLSGPVPLINNLSFFTTFRFFSTDGYRYGLRWFTPQGEKGDAKIVPMEPLKKLSGQFKLTYNLTNSMKLTYNFMGNDNSFRWYDRFYKYNPDGDLRRFENGQNQILNLTHTLSPTTFYEFKVSAFSTEYKHYVYEDPLKAVQYDSFRVVNGVTTKVPIYVASKDTYVHPDSGSYAPASWSFQDGGMQMEHFQRQTKYYVAKFDMTSQVTKRHQLKGGFEGRLYELTRDSYSVIPMTVENEELRPFQPSIPEKGAPNRSTYNFKPFEFSAYLQDKMEFKEMIINLGLRFDYFKSDAKTFADPMDPNIYDPFKKEHRYKNPDAPETELVEFTLAEREQFWWKNVKAKYQVSPRFGIAYPITDQGVIHFSYGHFFQMPAFERLYGDLTVTKTSGNSTLLTNPDLKPQKTVMYEIGLQQALTDEVAIDLTLFYRDIRDWIGASTLTPTYLKSVAYTEYMNKDYSNVKGVTLSLDKRYSNNFEASLDYTYMIAEGTASNPADEYNDRLSDRAPRIQIIPLGWDQRHTLNGHVSFGTSDFRVSLLGRYWAGTPYTPTFAIGEIAGSSAFSGLRENSALKPDITTFDLKINKQFNIGSLRYTVFAFIYNVLDSRGQTGVYDDTGDADYTLSIRNASSDPKRISLLKEDNAVHTEWYIEPRMIQVGFSIGF